MSAALTGSPLDRLVGPDELRAELQERLRCNYQKVVAKNLGVSAAYLNDYLQGRREPGAKLLRGLGLERVVVYRRVKPNVGANRRAAAWRLGRADEHVPHGRAAQGPSRCASG